MECILYPWSKKEEYVFWILHSCMEVHKMKILNYMPNDVNLYSGAEYDPESEKYKGGKIIRTFPSIGILNARMEEITEFVREDGMIFKHKRVVSFSCDDLPKLENTDTYLIVTRTYLAVAKQKGWNTSNLLTVGEGAVVDDNGRIVGVTFLTMN